MDDTLNKYRQLSLWDEDDFCISTSESITSRNLIGLSTLERKKRCFLKKHYLSEFCEVEGIEEFPKCKAYSGELPIGLVDLCSKKTD